MSDSSSRLHPTWLIGIVVVLLIAAVVAVSKMGKADEKEEEGTGPQNSAKSSAKSSSKSSSKPGSYRAGADRTDGKSDRSPQSSSDAERALMASVDAAREELQLAGGTISSVYANNEARKQLMEDLKKTNDLTERRRLQQEFNEKMAQARSTPTTAKTPEQRKLEVRLRTITYLPSLFRTAQQFGKGQDMEAELDSFQQNLVEFAAKARDMDEESFRAGYKGLQDEVQAIRKRNLEIRAKEREDRKAQATEGANR